MVANTVFIKRCWAAVLIVMTFLVSDAHAKRLALVVGNAAYVGESVLRNPVNDATDMAQALRGLGVQVFENKAHTNQSRQDMNALIGRFLNAAEGAELAVVYYAGHGIQSAGASYLLPVDAKITDERSVRTEGIGLNDVLADGADKRISRLAVILDACRNNPFTTRTRSASRGLAPPRETNGTLIAFATADGQVADDGTGRNGVYTEHLLRQLRTHGQSKSIRDLLEETQLAVRQARPDQLPKVYGDSALFRDVGLGGKIQLASLAPVPTGVPAQADPEQEAWDLAKRRDTVAAYEGFLATFPNGRLAASARSALAGLRPTPTPTPTPQPPVQAAKPGQIFKDCQASHCPEMVVIPAGSFTMGSNRHDNEKPTRSVNIRSFALGKYEVTQRQWKAVMGDNPSYFKNGCSNCPVESVRWDDIQKFLQKLNQMTGKEYRLPSEAEWEYAARAGTTTEWSSGNDASSVKQYAWYTENSTGRIQPVGTKQPNAFGLHDMHGNVWEWVQDVWHDNYNGAPTDGTSWTVGDQSRRVLRGGSWGHLPVYLRSASRIRYATGDRDNGFGFRIARTVP